MPEKENNKKTNVWNIVLKVVAAPAVTALLGALGIQSCINQ